MKGTIFVLVVGLGLGLVTCPLASAQTVFDDPNAADAANNGQPMPESANLRPLEPLAGSSDNQVSAVDTTGMQEAIDKFKLLFESGNADRLKKDIWPSMSPKQYRALKNAFKVVSQVSLQETCPGSPAVASDSAEWTCTERLAYYVTGKPQPAQIHPIQFRLKKVDGKWYVDGRNCKPKGQ
jgi:hypothetical protein